MDAIIVRAARAVASHPRLRILSYLARHGETVPTVLAQKLHMPLPTLSAHTKVLSIIGLVHSRKSGANCYYFAGSPYSNQTLSGQMSQWLRALLAEDGETAGRGGESVHRVVFEAATAFTDLRRLQILRRLLAGGEVTVDQLSNELSMSLDAVNRHTLKLRRRGYITQDTTADGSLAFTIASTSKSAIHARWLELVQQAWHQA